MGKENEADNTSEKNKKTAQDYERYNRMGGGKTGGFNSKNENFNRNLDLARQLEEKARNYDPFGSKSDNKVKSILGSGPITSGLTAVGKFSLNNQAKALKSGGMPVFDKKGKMQGVVSENFFGALVYSGNSAYSPIGRKDTGFNTASGSYTTDALSQDGGDGGDNVTSAAPQQETKAAGSISNATSGTKLAQKNQALEATVGGVDRRNFLSRGRRGGLGG